MPGRVRAQGIARSGVCTFDSELLPLAYGAAEVLAILEVQLHYLDNFRANARWRRLQARLILRRTVIVEIGAYRIRRATGAAYRIGGGESELRCAERRLDA